MIYVISRFLPLPFYPVGLAVLLCFSCFAALALNRRKAALLFSFLALVVLIVSSLPVTAHLLVRSLEKRYTPQIDYPKVSSIVLLGGAGEPPTAPRIHPETSASADRIMHAARLYHRRFAPYILATGGKIPFVREFEGSEAEVNESLLVELFGVPRSAILIDSQARNTHDHAPNARAILQQRNLPLEVIIVTSAMHMHRAVKVFESYGFTVYPAPTDYRADTLFQRKLMSFLPQVGAMGDTTDALHEYYGMLAYELLGWM